MSADREAAGAVRVWDWPVRLLHWSLALACGGAWLTTEIFPDAHQATGYVALAIAAARLAWGLTGGRYARLAQFVRGPCATWAYARQVWRGEAPRHIGHNPLGGWMALALWACVAALGLTGWLYTTDMFFGEAWLDLVHTVLAWLLVALVVLHLVGVVQTGRKHAERLVSAMLTGRKRAAGPSDVA